MGRSESSSGKADDRARARPGPGAADAEAAVLGTDAGRALLAEVAAVPRPGPADLGRWRKLAPADVVAAAVRLADCRRRASGKFSKADAMWLEPVGLEQATAEPVARAKAARFAGAPAIVDLCSGLGGDAVALASAAPTVAVDLDPGMARRARWNAGAYGVSGRMLAAVGRAEAFPIPPGTWVHVDPDRRAGPGSGRARSVEGYAPGPGFLLDLARSAPGGAIKLGPASDFEAHFGGPDFEVELVSLGGECKEATAWFGAAATCRRRATVLPAGATWTDRDAPDGAGPAPLGELDRWVFEPDAALVRSGLLDGFALSLGLRRFAPGVDLLTGPDCLSSPFLAAFEVVEAVALDPKRVRRMLAERGIGTPEVKARGLSTRPEEFARRLRLEGPTGGTLLLVGGRGPGRAVLTRRAPAH